MESERGLWLESSHETAQLYLLPAPWCFSTWEHFKNNFLNCTNNLYYDNFSMALKARRIRKTKNEETYQKQRRWKGKKKNYNFKFQQNTTIYLYHSLCIKWSHFTNPTYKVSAFLQSSALMCLPQKHFLINYPKFQTPAAFGILQYGSHLLCIFCMVCESPWSLF